MGTRSVIAHPVDNGFEGRYVHWDGMPSSKIPTLLALVARDGLDKVRETVHAHEWSSLDAHPDADRDEYEIVEGYGQAYRDADAFLWTREAFAGFTGIEYIYVLGETGIATLDPHTLERTGFTAYTEAVSPEELTAIECGANYERCDHLAWFHDSDAPRDMGMQQWVGLEPLGFRQVKHFVRGSTVLVPTGSGHTGTATDGSFNSWRSGRPTNYWWGSVEGAREDFRLARVLKGGGYKIEMSAVMPATRVAPEHTVPAGTVL